MCFHLIILFSILCVLYRAMCLQVSFNVRSSVSFKLPSLNSIRYLLNPGGPKGPPGPRGPEGALRCVKAGPRAPKGALLWGPRGPTPGARPGLLGIIETALRENCAASKLRCEETALRANGSAGMRGA